MIFAIAYTEINNINFKLFSKNANFSIENGWTDYFLPFCDEVEDDFDYADGEGKEKLRKILTVLDAGQLSKLLEEQLSEVAPEDFEGDYIQALVTQFKINLTTTDDSSYSFDAFIDEILEMISDLFGISVDIYGIMEE